MAIFIVENSGKIGYGIKKYICKTMADIPVEVDGEEIAPGSRIYVSDEKKTYMLDTAGQWVEITEGSGGGGGASSIDELSDVTITSPQEGQVLAYDETTDTWNNVANSAANKMDKVNPTGTGSLSLNRKANTTIGINSVAEGTNTTASGLCSHAEGSGSTASGDYSHAEGNTTASGLCSHAEGNRSKATGECSHAEGTGTEAKGHFSHAEGKATKAIGLGSHAEGIGTNATHYAQHVFGIFNELDGSANPYSQKGNYVEIVGNGTTNTRSNARTLDWQGNEVLAGDLTINGNQSVTQALNRIVNYYEVTGVLEAGQTSITLTHNAINNYSRLFCLTDNPDLNYKRISSTTGSVTLTFDVQTVDVEVVVQIWPELPRDPEAGLRISNAYTTDTNGTFTVTKSGLYFVNCMFYYSATDASFTITSNNAPLIQNSNELTKYCFINLEVGDTVAFSESEAFPGALIGNVTFIGDGVPSSVVSYTMIDGEATYTTPDDDKLYFVFAACADNREGMAHDLSTVGTKATTYAHGRTDTHAYMRVASCVGNDVTINMYGYQYGTVSILTVEMNRV